MYDADERDDNRTANCALRSDVFFPRVVGTVPRPALFRIDVVYRSRAILVVALKGSFARLVGASSSTEIARAVYLLLR